MKKNGFIGIILLIIGSLVFVFIALYVFKNVTFVSIPSLSSEKEQSVQEIKEEIQNADSDLQKRQKERLDGF